MKKDIKLIYLFGIGLGILLSLFIVLTLFATKKIIFSDNNIIDKKIMLENNNLKSDIAKKDMEIKSLNDKLNTTTLNKNDKSKNEKIIVDITSDMDNNKIADLLVSKSIYPHKNDLLMIMEIIGFNRATYSNTLENSGNISSAYEFNKIMKELESSAYSSAESLYSSGLVKDKASFMKVVYLLDINSKIKYGKKEFQKNSSLRQVCDILIN